ncbi:MAG: DeoR family transcriptional regulator, partial [Anaerostipes hadrus]
MIASERYETILNLIQEHGIVKVKDLAKLMQVTETTIRRDCEELEHQGKLIRVHGGAKGINQNKIVSNRDEKNVRDRTEFSESKELVCKKAASFVKEG